MRPPRQVNENKDFGAFFGDARASHAPPGAPLPPLVQIPRPDRRSHVDALLPLINIVFLLLIFLMMSGTLGTPLPGGLTLARSADARDPAVVAEALVIHPDGRLSYRGAAVPNGDLLGAVRGTGGAVPDSLTVVADGTMPAGAFLSVMRQLSDGGVATISLVTAPEPAERAP